MSEMIQMLEGLRALHGRPGLSHINFGAVDPQRAALDDFNAACPTGYCNCADDARLVDSGWLAKCRTMASDLDARFGTTQRARFDSKVMASASQYAQAQAAKAGYVAPEDPNAFQARLTSEGRRLLAEFMASGMSETQAKAEVQAWMRNYGAQWEQQAQAYVSRQAAQAAQAQQLPKATAMTQPVTSQVVDAPYVVNQQPTGSKPTGSKLPLVLGGLAVLGIAGFFLFRK